MQVHDRLCTSVKRFVFEGVLVCCTCGRTCALFYVCASGSMCCACVLSGQYARGNVQGRLAARTHGSLRKRNDRKSEWKFTAAAGDT